MANLTTADIELGAAYLVEWSARVSLMNQNRRHRPLPRVILRSHRHAVMEASGARQGQVGEALSLLVPIQLDGARA